MHKSHKIRERGKIIFDAKKGLATFYDLNNNMYPIPIEKLNELLGYKSQAKLEIEAVLDDDYSLNFLRVLEQRNRATPASRV